MTRRQAPSGGDGGFALLSVLVVIVIVGLIASTGLRTSELAESLSGSVIQRSRAFQAAEGALKLGERKLAGRVRTNAIADATASDDIFALGSVTSGWWEEDFTGASAAPADTFVGVTAQPRTVVGVTAQPRTVTEEVGGYVADGGSGIVSLDRGSGSYGRQTSSGRELVLFRLQSHGTGSVPSVRAVVESLYVQTR